MGLGTKKWLLIIGAVLVLFFVTGINTIPRLDEGVNASWAQVENQYQRRIDLIPNLVETVKGYANFEKSTLTDVINARANATKATISPDMLNNPEAMKNFEQAQGQLSSALSRLMVVVEKYPDLKANEQFLSLQSQLEGTENRIAVERKTFNEIVKDYNSHIRSFPNNLFAGMFGFTPKDYFKAAEGSDKAPEVKF
jgi:LemA protein